MLNLKELDIKATELINSITKEDFEAWMKFDELRMRDEKLWHLTFDRHVDYVHLKWDEMMYFMEHNIYVYIDKLMAKYETHR